MGVILDSSVLIAGDRRKESVRDILKRVRAVHGGSGLRTFCRDYRRINPRHLPGQKRC
jgi:hypothetical protein